MSYTWRLCTRASGVWDIMHDSGYPGFVLWHSAAEAAERWIVDVAFQGRGTIGHIACAVMRDGVVTHFRPIGGDWTEGTTAELDSARAQGRMFS